MILKRLSILNYRNLRAVDLQFSPHVNCLVGSNGMGKSNVLDAIHYLAFCRGFASAQDSLNVFHEADSFFLDSIFEKFQLDINEFDHMDDLSFDELCKEYRILSPETKKYANMLFVRMAECDGYVDPRELAIIQKLSQCTQ